MSITKDEEVEGAALRISGVQTARDRTTALWRLYSKIP